MQLEANKTVNLLDRMLARWEVSAYDNRHGSLALIAVHVSFPILICLYVAGASAFKALSPLWLIVVTMVVAFDIGRSIWTSRRPWASARWLHAVRVAVGNDIADSALHRLRLCHGRDANYVIMRQDMATSVRIAWKEKRDEAREMRDIRLQDF